MTKKRKKEKDANVEEGEEENEDDEELKEDVNDREVLKKSNSTTIFRTIFLSLLCIYYIFMKYLLNLFHDLFRKTPEETLFGF